MCVETGSLWEISATSSQFCCEPTTALKSRGGRKAQEGGATYKYIYIYMAMTIHNVVQQKPTQHCKAIIFQLKILKYKKML